MRNTRARVDLRKGESRVRNNIDKIISVRIGAGKQDFRTLSKSFVSTHKEP